MFDDVYNKINEVYVSITCLFELYQPSNIAQIEKSKTLFAFYGNNKKIMNTELLILVLFKYDKYFFKIKCFEKMLF